MDYDLTFTTSVPTLDQYQPGRTPLGEATQTEGKQDQKKPIDRQEIQEAPTPSARPKKERI